MSRPGRTDRPTRPGRRALPPIRAVLPGGTVEGQLVRRWQTEAGEWIYVVAVSAWSSRAATTGADVAEDFIEIPVPARQVRPVRGVSYEDVPTLRRRLPASPAPATARPEQAASPRAAATAAPAPPGDRGWTAERLRTAANSKASRPIRIHRPDCWTLPTGTRATLTTDQALWMTVHDPLAGACDGRIG
ncbi:hypothetical protein J7F03_36910 [Streptomyces sp. ISL-43]|uniref:hypothetical protein n=1 Tax=Streptomyces sp. ISL-43 TaxID=2819183 RepID=UPI001BE9A3E7|nr:hypothetical protein [Streptomyces sp. ISL-43]MBT2452538.1 hypothetical protein [Streptomyces sp. ISL-43]